MSSIFQVPRVNWVESKQDARDIAIQWQQWQAEQALSWDDMAFYEDYFYRLARKNGLIKEFRENGII